MADDPHAPEPADPEPPDVFEGLVLDENFVRGGVYEPPHRTREAIGRHDNQVNRLYPVDTPARTARRNTRAARASRANRGAVRSGRRDLASWLPLTVAITVVVLLLLVHR
jgi:hypothetical protein